MTGVAAEVVIGILTLALSMVTSIVTVTWRMGRMESQLEQVRNNEAKHATKDDVAALSRQVSEIRGMFRLVLRDPGET